MINPPVRAEINVRRNGSLQAANASACAMLQVDQDDLLNLPLTDIIPDPSQRNTILSAFDEQISSPTPVTFQIHGKTIQLLVHTQRPENRATLTLELSPLEDQDQPLKPWIPILSLFDESDIAVLLVDPNGAIAGCNRSTSQRAEKVFGKSLNVGDSLVDFILPSDVKEIRRLFSSAMAGQSSSVEMTYTWGEFKIPIAIYYSPIRDQDLQIIGVFFAIHELKPVNQASDEFINNLPAGQTKQPEWPAMESMADKPAQNSGDFFSTSTSVFEQSFDVLPYPTLIWRREEDGEIRLWKSNQAAQPFSQGRTQDFIGLTVDDFFTHAPHVANYIRETFKTGDPIRVELPYLFRSTGDEKWLLTDYVRFMDDYVLNVIRDITEQKQHQQAQQTAMRQIELLRQAMTTITSVLNVDQVHTHIMHYLNELIPYDHAFLFELDRDRVKISAAGGFNGGNGFVDRELAARNPQFDALNRTRFPIFLHNALDYKPFQELGDLNCGKSWLGVPLFGHGQMIGYLSIYRDDPGKYGHEEARLAQIYASEASIAIENARLFEQVQQLAITDGLTGFYIRRYFYELAEIEFQRSRRYKNPLTLIMFDVDYFKSVNDLHGHAVGDRVLIEMCACIRKTVRETDVLGRYGGEEFVLMLPETSLSNAMEAAERLRVQVENCDTFIEDQRIHVTISLGVAELDDSCTSTDEFFRRADQALYQAKQTGRNRVCSWTPSMDDAPPHSQAAQKKSKNG